MSSLPREFPSTGFEIISPGQQIEEERLPFYRRNDYYPMHIGEVVRGRYQVVAKLGYGTTSTVWLSRDLQENKYWVLKLYINTLKHNKEFEVYKHLANILPHLSDEPGHENVRQIDDSFQIQGPNGIHDVLIMKPLGMSMRTLQNMQKGRIFKQEVTARAIEQVLLGINFLHEANVIHTDLHSDNLLIALTSDTILSKVEENEIYKPSARKRIGDTIIYVSQYVLGGAGALTISDFGQARIGIEHIGKAMPMPYRAPEVILGMPWGPSVDTWSVGLLAWDLLEKEPLFRVYDHGSEEQNDACHLAAMTAILGPPPLEFLRRSEETGKYWDKDGNWKGQVRLPTERTLESLATALEGEEKDLFLNFIQCLLWWVPEQRFTPLQGYMHPWLRGGKLPPA
ncbi:protein kinase-like protein [Metarhizium acridum CQMa 102]|uniref:Protein kinase-like protein n=1 Tax=Metarhizium acridum (strain CQMa 102) TaxID=655827 RepID=E9DT81_METAQ|nr:protein kinase-like protein [Metarhizium acridum CQMa 102]EFY93180.1 protein kinase-like protein [Metarhizium acridum CQMa 102]